MELDHLLRAVTSRWHVRFKPFVAGRYGQATDIPVSSLFLHVTSRKAAVAIMEDGFDPAAPIIRERDDRSSGTWVGDDLHEIVLLGYTMELDVLLVCVGDKTDPGCVPVRPGTYRFSAKGSLVPIAAMLIIASWRTRLMVELHQLGWLCNRERFVTQHTVTGRFFWRIRRVRQGQKY